MLEIEKKCHWDFLRHERRDLYFHLQKSIFKNICAPSKYWRLKLDKRQTKIFCYFGKSAIMDEKIWKFFFPNCSHLEDPSLCQIWCNFINPIKRFKHFKVCVKCRPVIYRPELKYLYLRNRGVWDAEILAMIFFYKPLSHM